MDVSGDRNVMKLLNICIAEIELATFIYANADADVAGLRASIDGDPSLKDKLISDSICMHAINFE